MDQDFHYYGTYYAARVSGKYNREDASLIAKASNFIDFLNNGSYGGYWKIVSNTEKPADDNYDIVGEVDYPRYTFQGTISTGASESGGLWASYHFTPGNYPDPDGTPSPAEVHGKTVASLLPGHQMRNVKPHSSLTIDANMAKLLNRPQSALSRYLIQDTITCLTNPKRLEAILNISAGSKALLASDNKDDIVKRFSLILLDARAHVIADTWAHQDWSAANNVMNTYWNVDGGWYKDYSYQEIKYQDTAGNWQNVHLSSTYSFSNENLTAVPNTVCYVGHGWMGHMPDFSFIKYRYKPCWQDYDESPLERDNPTEYKHAFLELCSWFSNTGGNAFEPQNAEAKLAAAQKAISSACDIADGNILARVHSAGKWKYEMDLVDIESPVDEIDTQAEPDPKAVLEGQIHYDTTLLGTRYGTYYVNYASNLYLFEIAADYHFQSVKNWLTTHGIGADLFNDSWSQELGPLADADGIKALFNSPV